MNAKSYKSLLKLSRAVLLQNSRQILRKCGTERFLAHAIIYIDLLAKLSAVTLAPSLWGVKKATDSLTASLYCTVTQAQRRFSIVECKLSLNLNQSYCQYPTYLCSKKSRTPPTIRSVHLGQLIS